MVGNTAVRVGRYDQAIGVYQDAAARMGKDSKADGDAALELDPNNAVAMNNLAYLLSDTVGGDLAEALSLAQRAHELRAADPFRTCLCWSFFQARTHQVVALRALDMISSITAVLASA